MRCPPPSIGLWLFLTSVSACASGVGEGHATSADGIFPHPSADDGSVDDGRSTDSDGTGTGEDGSGEDVGDDMDDDDSDSGNDSGSDNGGEDDTGGSDGGSDDGGGTGYGDCSQGCPNGASCMQDSTMFTGSFCSPNCSDGAVCPPSPVSGSAQAACILGSAGTEPASQCALTCNLSANDCPPDMACVMSMLDGIALCTWP
jgi:hypothetical protein